jgi:predicted ATPase/class 3 adenylate cyclase
MRPLSDARNASLLRPPSFWTQQAAPLHKALHEVIHVSLPTGTVTFLFTDIEGSTSLWENHATLMRQALQRHDGLLREIIEANQGYVFKSLGDGYCAAFSQPSAALSAALCIQQALLTEAWDTPTPLRVRVALHMGEVAEQHGDYFGPPLNRIARLLGIAHGGQTILSRAVRDLVLSSLPADVRLEPHGSHRLKDLQQPEEVFELCHPTLPADFPPLRSLGVFDHNLPQQLTSFVGRDVEMLEIKKLLAGNRLVTLLGTGGAGKTRLALQVAVEVLQDFKDGVWLVELASLTEPDRVAQAIAQALRLKEEQGRSLTETLIDFLRDRSLLLVLDNAEHLVSAVAGITDTLLRACRNLRILATSREVLGISGEAPWRIPSLSLPDLRFLRGAASQIVPEMLKYESVRLFIERASIINPAFEFTPLNAFAVAQVCKRLDGIPLAIELAAARIKVMTVEQVAQRLDDRFRLLTGGSRTAMQRHQTLRAAIDWSYDLLPENERVLLRRLSIFSGGWTLEAAEAVCSGGEVEDWEILDLLSHLVDKSLVISEELNANARYRILESIRQYSRDRLLDAEEASTLGEKHFHHYLEMAEIAEPGLQGPDQKLWLEHLEQEHDNFRAALQWRRTGNVDPEEGLRMAGALWRFWYVRGYISEGRERLMTALSQSPTNLTVSRAKALNATANLAIIHADYTAARHLLEEARDIQSRLGDRTGLGVTLNGLGLAAWRQGHMEEAIAFFEQSIEVKRETGNKLGVAYTLNNLANIALARKDYEAAEQVYQEALTIYQAVNDVSGVALTMGNMALVARYRGENSIARERLEEALRLFRELQDLRGVAHSLANLAEVTLREGELDLGIERLCESMRLRRELGDRHGIAETLEGCARHAILSGRHDHAARLLGAAHALREEIGVTISGAERDEVERNLEDIREALGSSVFDALSAKGRALTMDQAVEMALANENDKG